MRGISCFRVYNQLQPFSRLLLQYFPCVGHSPSRFAPRWRIPIARFILYSLPSFAIIRRRCIMPLTTSRFSAGSVGSLRNTCILSHLLHEFRRLIPDPNADTVFFYFVDPLSTLRTPQTSLAWVLRIWQGTPIGYAFFSPRHSVIVFRNDEWHTALREESMSGFLYIVPVPGFE